MIERAFDLAQVNVALLRAPLDSEQVADFVAAIDPINALAEASPGFVWRLVSGGGDGTDIRAFGDDRIIVNMSTWASIDALRTFTFSTAHAEVMRNRRKWFLTMAEAYAGLWWVPRGHRPTVREGEERLVHLRTQGPTPTAFTFKVTFPEPTTASDASAVSPTGRAALPDLRG